MSSSSSFLCPVLRVCNIMKEQCSLRLCIYIAVVSPCLLLTLLTLHWLTPTHNLQWPGRPHLQQPEKADLQITSFLPSSKTAFKVTPRPVGGNSILKERSNFANEKENVSQEEEQEVVEEKGEEEEKKRHGEEKEGKKKTESVQKSEEHRHEQGEKVTKEISERPRQSQFPTLGPWWDASKRYLLHSFKGRLGNVLFQLSAMVCIARLNNLTLLVKDVRHLNHLRYTGIRLSDEEWKSLPIHVHEYRLKSARKFEPSLMSLTPTNASHSLTGYFQSWKYFKPCKAEVIPVIGFQDNVINRAVQIVTDLRQKLPGRTLVGVHVRNDIFLNPGDQVRREFTPPSYFFRAMMYFRHKFSDVAFVVISKKPNWFRTDVSNASDVIQLGRSNLPEVDMEVLLRLDHMVISWGTFGWWSAYKNIHKGAVVVYWKYLFYIPDSLGRKYGENLDDYFLPWWIPM